MENSQIQHSRFARIQLDKRTSLRSSSPTSALRSVEKHASTPPIPVPTPSSSWQGTHPKDSLENIVGAVICDHAPFRPPEVLSPIEHAARNRRSSISFDPQVKTDGGRHLPLQVPVARSLKSPVAPLLFASSPSSETSQMARESDFGPGETFRRSQSGSSSSSSSSGSSTHLGVLRNGSNRTRRRPSAAQKFLQQASPVLTEGVASLTSEATMSPISDLSTPPPNGDPIADYFDHSVTRSPQAYPVGGGLSPWSSSGLSPLFGPSKCGSYDRSTSRSRSRQRTPSGRSSRSGSAGISPASMFLSNFNSKLTPTQTMEPDAEGQEVGSYVLGKQIGYGGFSTVKEAFTIENDIEVKRAVKIVRKRVLEQDSENDRVQASFDHEISLWRILNHPRILSLVAVYDTPFATFAFMTFNTHGSLFDLLKKNRQGIPPAHVKRYASQLASALRYLHEDMRIVHGDVKLENCLLDMSDSPESGGNIVLCDFGLSRYMRNPHDEDDLPLPPTNHSPSPPPSRRCDSTTFSGSLQYASPELIDAVVDLSCPAADVWAFGVTMYALYTGSLPFQHSFAPKLQQIILKGNWDVDKLWRRVGADGAKAVEAIEGCLCPDAYRRWSTRRVLECPWMEGVESADSP